ncbi:hypothetical protein JV202_20220, partial [Shewanella algae]|uniref:hypothetical protein n=1 Tax=Shewanella algae TaxID=38313 RepID=UPI001C046962
GKTNLGQSVRYGHIKETKLTDWIQISPVKTDEVELCSYSLALGSLRTSYSRSVTCHPITCQTY